MGRLACSAGARMAQIQRGVSAPGAARRRRRERGMTGTTIEAAGVREILAALLHRYPFLMIDRVVSINGEESAIGIKNVTLNEPSFMGHFPNNPVYPVLLMTDATGQSAGVMCI